jgi:hypothetical protein
LSGYIRHCKTGAHDLGGQGPGPIPLPKVSRTALTEGITKYDIGDMQNL